MFRQAINRMTLLYALLRARYYWEQLYTDCRNHCKNCTNCLIAKNSGLNRQPLTPIRVGKLFDTWTIDILKIGPDAGNNQLLVCVESLSKWVEVFVLKIRTALL